MTLPETITSARTGVEHRVDHQALHDAFNGRFERVIFEFGTLVTLTGGGGPGGTAYLPIENPVGATLLNLTTPNAPTFIEAGIYFISCKITMSANLTAAHSYLVRLDLDGPGGGPSIVTHSPQPTTADAAPNTSLSNCMYFTAGAGFRIEAENNDTIDHGFGVEGHVQRIG